ncbi:MAG: ABC transporter ATP-binding protein [Candidatus Sericytochromatia bacterium]|nr:ABC transporter ATP-binding protein [Candidatus Sericytochromatia bacterium]
MPPAATPILHVSGVTKVYPGRFRQAPLTAVQDVSFDVRAGEILGLLGPNGAGKSTTLKMVTGLLRPTSGRITIAEIDVAARRSQAVRQVGAVLEGNRNLHWKLTARENLRYFGALKGVTGLRQRVEAVIATLDLSAHTHKRVGELSRGLQQRVAIGIALLGTPRLLVLDEPTLGLDVIAASEFQRTIRAIAETGCAIVLTTHQMEVAQALSHRIAIIAAGRLAALDSLATMREAYRTPGYEVCVRGSLSPAFLARLEQAGGRCAREASGAGRLYLPEGQGDALYDMLAALREEAVELVSLQQQEVDLEAIYRRIVEAPAP